jgi:O-antigen/teichoic acid export membrane protein
VSETTFTLVVLDDQAQPLTDSCAIARELGIERQRRYPLFKSILVLSTLVMLLCTALLALAVMAYPELYSVYAWIARLAFLMVLVCGVVFVWSIRR